MVDIPLFPLNTVLFPGAPLPLHIFEERYKLMIERCAERNTPFGVVLIASGQEVGEAAAPHDVGTTARIAHLQPQPDGRFNIMTVGVQRFRIRHTMTTEPYLSGSVEMLTDEDEDAPGIKEAVARVGELFTEYSRLAYALNDEWTRTVRLPRRPGGLADYVGAQLNIEASLKQQLLEQLSVPRRLSLCRRLLEPATELVAARLAEARRVKFGAFGVMN